MNRPEDANDIGGSPCPYEEARQLQLGELVLLEGDITVTAGFSTHQRMIKPEDARQLPFGSRMAPSFTSEARADKPMRALAAQLCQSDDLDPV